MTYHKSCWIRCDGCGKDTEEQSGSATRYRKELRKKGWRYENGEDYCPGCVKNGISKRKGRVGR